LNEEGAERVFASCHISACNIS